MALKLLGKFPGHRGIHVAEVYDGSKGKGIRRIALGAFFTAGAIFQETLVNAVGHGRVEAELGPVFATQFASPWDHVVDFELAAHFAIHLGRVWVQGR